MHMGFLQGCISLNAHMVDGRVLTRVVIQNIETCLRLKKNQIDQQIAKDLGSTAE